MIPGNSIRSVLVGVRLSQDSAEVVRAGADIALATGARLHVVHALEDTSVLTDESGSEVQRKLQGRRLELLGAVIGVTRKRVDLASVRVHPGPAAKVILAQAEEVVPDLIVLGPHRGRVITDRVGGSTVERVLRESSVPCLLLNGPLSLPLAGMVVAIDPSDQHGQVAGTSLRWAEWLSRAGEAKVAFASVTRDDPTGGEARAAGMELRMRVADARRRAEWDGNLTARILAGDDPVNEILSFARDIDAGMVVAGTPAVPAMTNAPPSGFSSTIVRRSKLPALLVPSRSSIPGVGPSAPPPRRRRTLVGL